MNRPSRDPGESVLAALHVSGEMAGVVSYLQEKGAPVGPAF